MTRTRTQSASAIAFIGSAALTAAACSSPTSSAGDADFPTETVTIVVPFSAGGSLDTNARLLAQCLSDSGGNWVVENQEGGSGTIGTANVIGSEPDGHTLGYIASTTLTLTPLLSGEDTEYTAEDLRPLAVVTESPAVLLARSDAPFDDVEEFLNGEPRTISTSSALGVYQLLADEMAKTADVEGVPFGGIAPAMSAALGGNADATLVEIHDGALEQVSGGDFTALAVAGEDVPPSLSDVPTLADQGFDLPPSENHGVLLGPADLPDDIAETITDRTTGCLENGEVREGIGTNYVLDPPVTGHEAQELISDTVHEFESVLDD